MMFLMFLAWYDTSSWGHVDTIVGLLASILVILIRGSIAFKVIKNINNNVNIVKILIPNIIVANIIGIIVAINILIRFELIPFVMTFNIDLIMGIMYVE